MGIDHIKGKIATGYDADLVIWDPEAVFEVTPDQIQFKHPITPYLGHKLKGVVSKTFVNGQLVFDKDKIDPVPRGVFCLKIRNWKLEIEN